MKEFIKNNIKLVSILIIVIVLGIIGVTYAALTRRINIGITTGEYNVVYTGTSTLPSSDLSPVPDSSVRLTASQDKVLKVEFTVKGAQTNPTDKDIIYDVSLTDLNIPEELKNSNFKWRLYKNNTLISEGTFIDGYDPENENRMVLTYTQQDLPDYSKTADSYAFYAWLSISEACESDITNCTEEEAIYSENFMNKTLSGNIRIELSTGSKITRVLGEAGKTITKLGLEDSIKSDTPNIKNTSCKSGCEESTVGIYRTVDDLGISYYFRGDVENNYVKFAGYYWRIVRINGDGTIRMIYDGTDPHENGTVSEDRVLEPVSYNEAMLDVSFVGYMNGTVDGVNFPNGTTNSTNKAEARANISDSTIKSRVDIWYEENFKDTEYEQYIADAIYCNDRNLSTITTKLYGINATTFGYGINHTAFGFYDNYDLNADGTKMFKPSLFCQNKNDRFTAENSLGNEKLKYPIALLTYQELILSGLPTSTSKTNQKFYLYNGFYYWTMTPHSFIIEGSTAGGVGAVVIAQRGNGSWNGVATLSQHYIKPVISLKSDAIKYGTGISDDPFRITEAI